MSVPVIMIMTTMLPTELAFALPISWLWTAGLIAAVALQCGLLISLGTWLAVRNLSPDRLSMCPLEPGECAEEFEAANRVRSRVEPLGFEWDSAHLFITSDPVFVGIWRHLAERTWFVLYISGAHRSYEFVTRFDPNPAATMLTTSNSKDALLLPPPPERLVAAFPKSSVEDLWQRHAASCEALQSELSIVRADAADVSPAQLIRDTVIEQVRHVRSLPLWPLRGLWWYVLRRNALAGRPIAMPHRVSIEKDAHAAPVSRRGALGLES